MSSQIFSCQLHRYSSCQLRRSIWTLLHEPLQTWVRAWPLLYTRTVESSIPDLRPASRDVPPWCSFGPSVDATAVSQSRSRTRYFGVSEKGARDPVLQRAPPASGQAARDVSPTPASTNEYERVPPACNQDTDPRRTGASCPDSDLESQTL